MSKTLLKLVGITAIAFSCFYLFIFVIAHLTIPYSYMVDNMYDYIALLILAIFSLISILGGMIFLHYKELPDEKLKEKRLFILTWSIVFLITSGICGILGFAAYICLSNNACTHSKFGYMEEILELEKLKKRGLITEEEFSLKKGKILDI